MHITILEMILGVQDYLQPVCDDDDGMKTTNKNMTDRESWTRTFYKFTAKLCVWKKRAGADN